MGTWQAAATSKNAFTILKRFLQIRSYLYGKFSLLIDSLEFEIITSLLRVFGNKRGNESNPDKKQPKGYLTELKYTQLFLQIFT